MPELDLFALMETDRNTDSERVVYSGPGDGDDWQTKLSKRDQDHAGKRYDIFGVHLRDGLVEFYGFQVENYFPSENDWSSFTPDTPDLPINNETAPLVRELISGLQKALDDIPQNQGGQR